MKRLSEVFAENLKFYRKKAGLTQKELAARMGYTEKAVSKWESGMTIPPAETLVALAELLSTSVDTMLEYARKPSYFLGIDGGATKTMFALADAEGKVVRHLLLGPCNPVDIGFERSETILSDGIRDICKGIPCSSVSVFAGLSAGNAGNNAEIFTEFFRRFRFAKIGVANDARNIISAGLGESDGIAVIMGTGSVAYSRVAGAEKQYGGFGYLFDEGGDGYNIGRDAINAALYDETGAGRQTLITTLLAKKNGASANSMITRLYEGGKRYIASFAPVVFEAYDRGDAVAADIISRNMKHISGLINAALSDFDGGFPVKVVFVGGLTKRSDVLFKYIRAGLRSPDAVSLSVYPFEPVLGALALAGAPVNTGNDNGIRR